MPIPALIVSGHLGSGKTTLVGRLLAEAKRDGVRLAVVSNEFGDTGIDRALLDAGSDGFVELDGGCVCCRLSDALSETLCAIVEKVRPDRLLIETSGLALPGEILIQFWRDPLDAIVSAASVAVVVDASRWGKLSDDETFLDQIDAADVLLLNKLDLVDPEEIREADRWLSERAPGRRIFPVIRGDIEGRHLFPPDTAPRRPPPEAHEDHDHGHDRYDSSSLPFPGTVDPDAVIATLRALDPIRAKGFVRGPSGTLVIQGVGDRYEVTEPDVPPPEALIGVVVVIRKAEGA